MTTTCTAMPVTAALPIAPMQATASAVCDLLKVLSNPDRLLLLCNLLQRELCVSELEVATGILQPSLSQQLGVLRRKGVVCTRREGKQIYYYVCNQDAAAVMQLLYERFCKI